ncbi:MAG: glycoside hydrolase family 92 protein, partial [Chitinophagaceae bacterium]
HVAYLFNWTGQPWKTQEKVRMIIPKMYKPTVDGLGGNDDCGQMSAWYLFSALGFYPVAPASGEYSLGSPLVKSATIKLENGNQFSVEAKNQSKENVYVQGVTLNGVALKKPVLLHSELMKGGKLVFRMGAEPNKTLFN